MKSLIASRNAVSRLRRDYRSRRLLRTPFFSRFGFAKSALLTESRTHVSLDRKFVYSRVPKAGNSTVIATLYTGKGDVSDREYIERIKKGELSASLLSSAAIDDILNNYFIFTFVRNPFSRVISCFNDKLSKPSSFRALVSRFYFSENDREISFDQFLDFISEEKNIYLDAHWAPQVDLLPFPIERYDLIGSVENMSDSLNYMMQRVVSAGGQVDYRPHATGASNKALSITDAQAQKIISIYRKDFTTLGYSELVKNATYPPEIAG